MKPNTKPKLYSRFFNTIIDHGEFLEKKSYKQSKLIKEYDFYQQLPMELIDFYPNVQAFKQAETWCSYQIQKINVTDASYFLIDEELFSPVKLKNMLDAIKTYLDLIPRKIVSEEDFARSFQFEILEKNNRRLSEICNLPIRETLAALARQHGFKDLADYQMRLNSAIKEIALKENKNSLYFSHGDLTFSNILFDGTRLYLIDPKGDDFNNQNFRIIHYDLCKISQSLLGQYDFINHIQFTISKGQLVFNRPNPVPPEILDQFNELVSGFGISERTLRLVEASLFFSLIPFHQDSNQKMCGFFLNSIKIYKEYL